MFCKDKNCKHYMVRSIKENSDPLSQEINGDIITEKRTCLFTNPNTELYSIVLECNQFVNRKSI